MKIRRIICIFLALITTYAIFARNPAAVPTLRNTWLDKHNKQVEYAHRNTCEIMFLGDSITEGWMVQARGLGAWNKYYLPLKAVNFGISGDRTEHVLWRLESGGILSEKIQPKLVVLLIGTNNIWRDSEEQIAEGVSLIVKDILERAHKANVLLLAIFPRSQNADNPVRAKIAKTNALIEKLTENPRVTFLDIGKNFLEPDGDLSPKIMNDYLHLTPEGYEIWVKAMDPYVKKLL